MDKNEMSMADREILQRRLKERRLFLNMTYQDLADKTGISKSTLQRYETGGIKNLPYDKIFILSEALEVSPKYFTDLSKDYTGEPDNMVKMDSRTHHLLHIKEFEERAIRYITPNLISQGYNIERHSHGSVGDIVAIKGKEIWHIDFLYINWENKRHRAKMGNGTHQLFMRFGRLAVYNKQITKFSIVVNKLEIAEHLIQHKPIHLDINTSIITLNENGFEEHYYE